MTSSPTHDTSADTSPSEASTTHSAEHNDRSTRTDSARTQRAPRPKKKKSGVRRLVAQGWIPDQHGAWAMALVPVIVGAVIGGFTPFHLLLIIAWMLAFLAFHVFTVSTKAVRKERYRPAQRTWMSLAALCGTCVLLCDPLLISWAPLFLPLATISVIETLRGHERSLLSRVVTISASCLMLPVAFGSGRVATALPHAWPHLSLPSMYSAFQGGDLTWAGLVGQWTHSVGWDSALSAWNPLWVRMWVLAAVCTAYFLGTVPYVRSLIRGRREIRWVALALLWHVAAGVGMVWACVHGFLTWVFLPLWVALLIRAGLLPWWQRHRGNVRPAIIGMIETLASLAVTVMLCVSF